MQNRWHVDRFRIELLGPVSADSLRIGEWLAQEVLCYLRVDLPRAPISWRWPLRLGFGVDDGSTELELACRECLTFVHPWAARLTTVRTLTQAESACDLMYVPFDGALPIWLTSSRPGTFEADACVLLVPAGVRPASIPRAVHEVRRLLRPSAVAWQWIVPNATYPSFAEIAAEFATSMVREISHSRPFDFALYLAAGAQRLIPGFVVSSRRFLDNSGLAHRLRNQKAILQGNTASIELPADSRVVRDFTRLEGWTPLAALSREIPEEVATLSFLRESDTATTMVELDERTDEAVRAAEPPRYIQARVLLGNGSQAPLQAFVRGHSHVVEVCIAGPIQGWVGPSNEQAFPEDALPAELDEHEVQIAIAMLHAPYECQTQAVILPRRGPTAPVRFQLATLPEADEVTLRIIIAFRNRILQTALLSGSVVNAVEGVPKLPLTLTIESLLVNRFDALHERSRFGTAILLNRTRDEHEGVTFLSDNQIRFDTDKDLAKIRKFIDDEIGKVAYELDGYADIFTDKSQKLLWKLAYLGHQLRGEMERLAGQIPLDSRIQILCVEPRHKLPVEYCYDDERPVGNAPVCQYARQGLQDGVCPAACPSGKERQKVVCPLKFWATRRVIERHVFDPTADKQPIDDFERQWLLGGNSRREMNPFERVLYGLSGRVGNYDVGLPPRVAALFGELPPAEVHVVDEWPAWMSTLAHRPSMLLVIGHVEEDELIDIVPKIEIGQASWLRAPEWDQHVRSRDTVRPLVVLLGCEVGSSQVELLGFVASVLKGGAGILMTTNSSIHAKHAVELVEELLPKLRDACVSNGTFGEVLRDARRLALAKSSPMPLCVVAFGDADWKLTRPEWFQNPRGDVISPDAGDSGDDAMSPQTQYAELVGAAERGLITTSGIEVAPERKLQPAFAGVVGGER
jgi:hypothetical protein